MVCQIGETKMTGLRLPQVQPGGWGGKIRRAQPGSQGAALPALPPPLACPLQVPCRPQIVPSSPLPPTACIPIHCPAPQISQLLRLQVLSIARTTCSGA